MEMQTCLIVLQPIISCKCYILRFLKQVLKSMMHNKQQRIGGQGEANQLARQLYGLYYW